MIPAYLYRLMGTACLVVLFANVYKHGWHPVSVGTGATLTVLMFSLGVPPERRSMGWELRYLMTVAVVAWLAAFRFLR